MKSNQSGFTLIEIAIVLVIIGLLLGGVLKGQELINSAKVKRLSKEFSDVQTLIFQYQDKFRVLPGDDPSVQLHVGTATTTATQATGTLVGNGTINGTWDSVTGTAESVILWQHLRMANLVVGLQTIPGTLTILDPYFPMNAVGGRLGIQGNLGTADSPNPIAGLPGTNVICSASIPGKFAKLLDIALDDQQTNTGSMRTTLAAAGATIINSGQLVVTTTDIVNDTLYTVCMGV